MRIRVSLILPLLIALAFCTIASAQSPARAEVAGEAGVVFDRELDFADRSAKVLERAQAYLWDAWENRRKVKFNIYEYNREGDRVNLTMRVGPGPGGEWRVEESSVIDRCEDAGTWKRSCRLTPVVTVYDTVRWEDLVLLTPPVPTRTNIKILVLSNSKSGARYELRRGALF